MSNLLVFALGFALLAWAGWIGAREAGRRSRRLAAIAARLEALRPSADRARGLGALFGPDAGPRFLRVRFARADLELGRRSVVLSVVTIAGATLVGAWFGRAFGAALVLGAAVAIALPALEFIAARNVAALLRELPFLLDSVRQHLTVGASLQQALIRAVEQGGPAVQRCFAPAVRRMQNGATLVESMAWLAARLELAEIDMLSVAVQTNTRFGGAMSPTLANLGRILRDQARVNREMKAATAETRMSGWVLAGLPVGTMAVITVANPHYASFLTSTSKGHVMLGVAIALQAMGAVAMARIMRVDF